MNTPPRAQKGTIHGLGASGHRTMFIRKARRSYRVCVPPVWSWEFDSLFYAALTSLRHGNHLAFQEERD
jgi:hypothetical protein